MVVAHNLMATYTANIMGSTNKSLKKNTEKLSSGYQINRAADDAAGLSISEKMRHLIRNIDMATKNTEDAISFCQTADGAMNELHAITKRIRELLVQGANDTNDDVDRQAIQNEINELSGEVDYVVNDTKFNNIKVFGKNRSYQTIDNNVADPTEGTSEKQIVEVQGTNYGLGEILGKNHISSAEKMGDRITMTPGTGWVSTGNRLLESHATPEFEAHVASLIGLSDLSYSSVKALPNSTIMKSDAGIIGTANSATITGYVTDASGKTTNYMCSYYQDLEGDYLLHGVEIDDEYTSFYRGYGNGEAAWGGSQHNASWLDFEELGKRYQLEDLYDQGFNVTCGHCPRHYSIIFTDGNDGASYSTAAGGTRYHYEGGGADGGYNKLLKVDISGSTSGADIVNKIMDAADATFLTEHLTEYATNVSNPNRIYIYDNCASGSGSFEPIARHVDGTVASDTKVSYTGADNITHIYDDSDLWIQSGGVSGQGLMMQKPWITSDRLGLSRVAVSSHEAASDSLSLCDEALKLISTERSRVGAYTNRFEHTIENNNTSSENLSSAESLIRDTNMATEMTSFSKNNILMQAAQSMLTQANNSNQEVLSLLGA